MYPKFPAFCRWRERMDNLPTTRKLARRRPARPIAHAREWANFAPPEILIAKNLPRRRPALR